MVCVCPLCGPLYCTLPLLFSVVVHEASLAPAPDRRPSREIRAAGRASAGDGTKIHRASGGTATAGAVHY